eukprot:TRINITY_DN23217_c0_g2_i1.p1 TRINITY_DN23217_c0_g2~~TRINITY_DN23217_c0_g2_i1.p1  ORF type:complete len:856 (+),score=75.79 TRINITY_DN23217_c0_g2_i1:57-2624(+)
MEPLMATAFDAHRSLPVGGDLCERRPRADTEPTPPERMRRPIGVRALVSNRWNWIGNYAARRFSLESDSTRFHIMHYAGREETTTVEDKIRKSRTLMETVEKQFDLEQAARDEMFKRSLAAMKETLRKASEEFDDDAPLPQSLKAELDKEAHKIVSYCIADRTDLIITTNERIYQMWSFRLMLSFGQLTLLVTSLPLSTLIEIFCSTFVGFAHSSFDNLPWTRLLFFSLPLLVSGVALVASSCLALWFDAMNSPQLAELRATLMAGLPRIGHDDPVKMPKKGLVKLVDLLIMSILDLFPVAFTLVMVCMQGYTSAINLFFIFVEAQIYGCGIVLLLFLFADINVALKKPSAILARQRLFRAIHIHHILLLSTKRKQHLFGTFMIGSKADISVSEGVPDDLQLVRHFRSLLSAQSDHFESNMQNVRNRVYDHWEACKQTVYIGVAWAVWVPFLYAMVKLKVSVPFPLLLLAIALLLALSFFLGSVYKIMLPEVTGLNFHYKPVLCVYLLICSFLLSGVGTGDVVELFTSDAGAFELVSYAHVGFRNDVANSLLKSAYETPYPFCASKWGREKATIRALDLALLAKIVYEEDDVSKLRKDASPGGWGSYGRHMEHLFPRHMFNWIIENVTAYDAFPRYMQVYFTGNSADDNKTVGTRVIAIKGTSTPFDMFIDLYFKSSETTIQALNDAVTPIFAWVRPEVMEWWMSLFSMRLEATARNDWLNAFIHELREIKARHPRDFMIITGHSLGGWMTEISAADVDALGVAWSGMGTKYDAKMAPTSRVIQSILNVVPEHDLVPRMGIITAAQQPIHCLGYREGSPASCHLLDRTICEVVRVCDDVEVGRNFSAYCTHILSE